MLRAALAERDLAGVEGRANANAARRTATLEAFAVSRETILSMSNGPKSSETRKRFTDGMLELMSDI